MHDWRRMPDEDFKTGRDYVGASDLPVLAGLTAKYSTPLTLWEERTGRREPFAGNNFTKWGHIQETNILAEYVYQKYLIVYEGDEDRARGKRDNFIIARMRKEDAFGEFRLWTESNYPGRPRHVSHTDMIDLEPLGKMMGISFDEESPLLIQAKNSGLMSSKRKNDGLRGYDDEDKTANGIPTSVFLQEQWETYTYGIEQAIVIPLINGNDWRMYGPVLYNKKIVEQLMAIADRFLECVDSDTPPEPKTWKDVIALNPDYDPKKIVIVDPETEVETREMLSDYGRITKQIQSLEEKKDDIKNAMGLIIGGGARIETEDGTRLASASEIKGRRTVLYSEVKKHPEILELLENTGLVKTAEAYRNLYIKGTPSGKIENYYFYTSDDNGENWKSNKRKKYTVREKEAVEKALVNTNLLFKFEKVTP